MPRFSLVSPHRRFGRLTRLSASLNPAVPPLTVKVVADTVKVGTATVVVRGG